jgi:hypothetical protein
MQHSYACNNSRPNYAARLCVQLAVGRQPLLRKTTQCTAAVAALLHDLFEPAQWTLISLRVQRVPQYTLQCEQ